MPAYFDTGLIRDKAAWHGDGNVKSGEEIDAMTVDEACAGAGLDYEIEEVPLVPQFSTGGSVLDEATPVTSHKALVNGDTGEIISVVGAKYRPLQNVEAFRFFNPFLADGDAVIETAGSCKGGQIVWVMCRIDADPVDIVKGDTVKPYLTLGHGHDGKTAIHVMFQNVRIVCWNTWRAAVEENQRSNSTIVKVRHTKNVLENLDNVRAGIDLAKQQFVETTEIAKAMANKELTVEGFKNFVQLVHNKSKTVNEKVLVSLDDGTIEEQTHAKVVAAMPQNYAQLENLFDAGTGTNIPGVRGTLWGAFNAVTEHVDYVRGKDDQRLTSAWYGTGGQTKDRAWEVAVSLL